MAYSSINGHLPHEFAKRTGHLPIVLDPHIRALIESFKTPPAYGMIAPAPDLSWNGLPQGKGPITEVISCDGSFCEVEDGLYRLGHIVCGLVRMPVSSRPIAMHPFDAKRERESNSDRIQTVLPLDVPNSTEQAYIRMLREAIWKTLCYKPELLETLSWLLHEQWNIENVKALKFSCPSCGQNVVLGPTDTMTVCNCGETVCLSDYFGWHNDISHRDPEDAVTPTIYRFMTILEYTMLLSCIRTLWSQGKADHVLFVHDGPLSIGGRYARLIPPIRRFLNYAQFLGHPVRLIGVEKTGRYVNHLNGLQTPQWTAYAIPSYEYIVNQVGGGVKNGEKNMLGRKVFLSLPATGRYVISVPPIGQGSLFRSDDLNGLFEILQVFPLLVTPVFENAIFPLTRVNALVSIAQEPCGRMLELFSKDILNS